MSYQKHIWVAKEIIRKERLNHIEDGIFNEEQRAMDVENNLSQILTNEIERASDTETEISNRVTQNTMDIAVLNANSGYRLVEDHTTLDNPKDNIIYIEKNEDDVYEQWIYQDEWIKIGG